MPSFGKLFMESKGNPISYQGKELIMADDFAVESGDVLVCSIERVNNKFFRQGFCIDITGHCEMDGKILKAGKGIRMLFWGDTAAKQIKLKIITNKKTVLIYNICERNVSCLTNDTIGSPIEKSSKTIDYWIGGAAMVVEAIEDGKRYHCSDVSCADKKDQFGDIVFTVQKMVKKSASIAAAE